MVVLSVGTVVRDTLGYAGDHVGLLAAALLISVAVALPLAALVVRSPSLRRPIPFLISNVYSPAVTALAMLVILAEASSRFTLLVLVIYTGLILLRHALSVVERSRTAPQGVEESPRTGIDFRKALPGIGRALLMAAAALLLLSAAAGFLDASGIRKNFDLSYFDQNRSDVYAALKEHLILTLKTLVIAMAIALPLGTLVARVRVLYTPVMTLVGIVYTIPSFAFLAMLVPYVGIGATPALIALVSYAQFILVRNVAVGLSEVDPAAVDAARGMGMNAWQILYMVEYPLALPVILGGLRIATVATIAIATIAARIDAGGLGTLLFDGVDRAYYSEILTGAVAVALLAIAADIILRLAERLLPATRARAASP